MFEIKKLNPDLIKDFTDYLEGMIYDYAPQWKTCYCHFYHNNLSYETWLNRSGKENKMASIQAIYDGQLTGFLIYKDHVCIGWLNANEAKHYPRLHETLKPYVGDKKIAVSICFIIHPKYREQGIARKLLTYAIEYYQNLGFDGMLALPSVSVPEKDLRYRGTPNMYLENDYVILKQMEHFTIMYKSLKKEVSA